MEVYFVFIAASIFRLTQNSKMRWDRWIDFQELWVHLDKFWDLKQQKMEFPIHQEKWGLNMIFCGAHVSYYWIVSISLRIPNSCFLFLKSVLFYSVLDSWLFWWLWSLGTLTPHFVKILAFPYSFCLWTRSFSFMNLPNHAKSYVLFMNLR